jgi:hypothetical protein
MGGAIQRDGARIVLLAVAAVLAFGLAAGTADAKKKKKKAGPVVGVSQTQTIQAEENGTVVATCPERATVVGGGFSSTPLDGTTLEGVIVRESRMEGNGWTASAANLSASEPGSFSAFAYCRKRTKPLVAVSATVFNCFCLPVIDVVATCPTGLKPVAGGFSGPLTFADGGALPQMSRRFGAFAWKFLALDVGLDPSNVTAYAYCAPKAALETTGVRVIQGENSTGTASAPFCKRRGRKMLAGGFQAEATSLFGLSVQLITASVRDAGRWATTGLEAFEGPGTLQSFGYCR